MVEKGGALGPKAREQIKRLVREDARKMMNEMPQRGRWQAVSAEGQMLIVRFQITEADCENGAAIVKVLSYADAIPESYEVDGQNETDEFGRTVPIQFLVVYDKVGSYLNESNRNLYGRIGHAVYMYGRPRSNYQPWQAWEIIGIAEQQTECESY